MNNNATQFTQFSWETVAVLGDGHVFKLIPSVEQTDENTVCLIRQKPNGEWVNRGNFASVKDGLNKI